MCILKVKYTEFNFKFLTLQQFRLPKATPNWFPVSRPGQAKFGMHGAVNSIIPLC